MAVLHSGALALDAAGATLLRDVVHYHQAHSVIRPDGTFLRSVMPHGWYEDAPPARPPTLNDAIAVLTMPTRAV